MHPFTFFTPSRNSARFRPPPPRPRVPPQSRSAAFCADTGAAGLARAVHVRCATAHNAIGTMSEEEPGAASSVPASRSEAARFLTQASFGPTEAGIERVMPFDAMFRNLRNFSSLDRGSML